MDFTDYNGLQLKQTSRIETNCTDYLNGEYLSPRKIGAGCCKRGERERRAIVENDKQIFPRCKRGV